MKRRDFLKQNGELWLYSILFGKIALSCTKESIGKNKTISHDIKGVYELVQIHSTEDASIMTNIICIRIQSLLRNHSI